MCKFFYEILLSESINGFLVLDKPSGITSTKAGSIVKRLLNVKKIGHLGTLDPLATGVLVLAIGKATKLIPYLEKNLDNSPKNKVYEFAIKFGKGTDTYDAEGKIVDSSTVLPCRKDIEEVCSQLLGKQKQIPPLFSAIKINGKRLCDIARRNIKKNINSGIEIKSREVNIVSLKISEYIDNENTRFETECSGGTYVRSLAVEIAKRLGTFGFVTSLRRKKDGNFYESMAISLEKLEKIVHTYSTDGLLVSMESVLGDILAFSVSEQEVERISRGCKVAVFRLFQNFEKMKLDLVSDMAYYSTERSYGLVAAFYKERLLALGNIKSGEFFPNKVFLE